MGDQPISESDAIFARAYASAVKSFMGVDIGKHYCILTSPVTQRGMAAGNLIHKEMTNYLIYQFADNLQYSDNPSYVGGSAGSYIQQLQSYVNWIQGRGDHSQVNVDRMGRAQESLDDATTNFFKVKKEARAIWEEDEKEDYPGVGFLQWASAHYPALGVADSTLASAAYERDQAAAIYNGPDAPVLDGYKSRIKNALDETKRFTSYNQEGLLDDLDLIAKAVKSANGGQKLDPKDITQATSFIPLYTIGTYISGVQAWITKAGDGGKRDQILKIDTNEGKNTTWEDYGFKQVHSGAGGGIWPFFSAVVIHNGKEEARTLDTKGRENDISLVLAMIGIQKFNIAAGQWDIPNIRAMFPTRRDGAPPDVLSSKFARIVSVLVGYDVELKIQFSSALREEVHKIYEEVKATKGRMSILGFRVDAGASGDRTDQVETKFDDVKWDKATGSMSLTPTKGQVYPTILAAVAQRLGD